MYHFTLRKYVNGRLLPALVAAVFCLSASGQQSDKAVQHIERNNIDNTPTLIDFTPDAGWKDDQAAEIFRQYLGVDGADIAMKLRYSTTSKSKVTAKRYDLYVKGIKVEYGSYTLSCRNGIVTFMTGNYYNIDKGQLATPVITEAEAFGNALHFVGAEKYMWEDPLEEQRIRQMTHNPDTSLKPKGKLTWVEDMSSGVGDRKLHLAYAFNIYARSPLSRQMVFVDAVSGKILHSNSLIKHTAANGHTRYSGVTNFQTANTGATYLLYDSTRGSGIHTLDMNNGSSYGAATEYASVTNTWPVASADSIALDAHWGAEVVYDYWFTQQGRRSYDDLDGQLLQYVHYQSGYNNAFWDGAEMTYGDGSGCGSGFTPLTSLDVTAHEIGHGVCEYTANLVYSLESGAMNEAFSDCWGATIEAWGNPLETDAVAKNVWWIGEEVKCGNPLRKMDFPKLKGQPDTYGGTNWFNVTSCTPSGGNDECGVHTNSGVMNKWYYLVAMGGTGTNDLSNTYSVTAVGLTEAANILYQTELVLSSTANYALMRSTSISTASTLYGPCSQEVVTVTNAWYAVGVGSAYVALPLPITGATSVCVGAFTVLADATPGGTWSSSFSSIATVGAGGLVTGVAAGVDTIAYTLGVGCDAKKIITVNALPTAIIAPAPSAPLCVGGGTAVLSATTGAGLTYQWKLAGSPVFGATNAVFTATVTGNYSTVITNTNGCSATSATTNVFAVAPPLAVISPVTPTTFCAGSVTTLGATVGTGYTYQWRLGGVNISGATAQTYITGAAGSYDVIVTSASGCSTTSAVTTVNVNPLPAPITGTPSVCFGASTLLSDATTPGVWSSSNTLVATVSTGGNVTGMATTGGVATITYTIGTGCYVTQVVTVNTATPPAIAGPAVVCTGQTVTLVDAMPGGIWSGNNPAKATVTPAGVVTGVAVGAAIISYTITNACGTGYATFPISISNPVSLTPTVTVHASPATSCIGDPVTFTATATNGGTSPTYTWTRNGATVGSGPTLTYVPTNGDIIVCHLISNYPCIITTSATSAPLVQVVQSHLINTVSIFVSKSGIAAGALDTFVAVAPNAGSAPAYQWLLNGAAIPGATNAMYITSTLANGQAISCRVASSLPCAGPATAYSSGITVNVYATGVDLHANGQGLELLPNPNSGVFTIAGYIRSAGDGSVHILVTDMLGQTVYESVAKTENGQLHCTVALDKTLANGLYLVRVTGAELNPVFHMVLSR